MTRGVGHIIATNRQGKDQPAVPPKSKPEVVEKGKKRNPVLWPETTGKPPVLKKPPKKKAA